MGIFEKFKFGFKKSAENIKSGLKEIIVKKEIDDETLNKIEEFLISSDVGIDAATEIKSKIINDIFVSVTGIASAQLINHLILTSDSQRRRSWIYTSHYKHPS